MKRELKEFRLATTTRMWLGVSDAVPMKRELKDIQAGLLLRCLHPSFRRCPYEEGTERQIIGITLGQAHQVSDAVPMKRELKDPPSTDTSRRSCNQFQTLSL